MVMPIYIYYMHVFISFFFLIVITITFNQSEYSVNEDIGSVQLVLVLSNPSSFVETVQVFSTDISATGT